MLNEIPLASGRRLVGRRTTIGTLGRTRPGGEISLLEVFAARAGLSPEEARTVLAKFGLGAHAVLRPERSLSPGSERAGGSPSCRWGRRTSSSSTS